MNRYDKVFALSEELRDIDVSDLDEETRRAYKRACAAVDELEDKVWDDTHYD